jgi:hypothetical protein
MNKVYPKTSISNSTVKKARQLTQPSLYKEEKVKMIVRFARWLLNKFDNPNDLISSISVSERILDRHNNTVTFSVHPASGGYVIESAYYNEREDRHMRGLHIITNEEDFAKELGSAVFMDLLKNR